MIDPNYDCPSLLELEEVRLGLQADEELEHHLADCARCRTLLAVIGDPPELDAASTASLKAPMRGARRHAHDDVGVRTGALWRAVPDADADFAWVVAIIGRSPDNRDALLVAPVAGMPQLATDNDLLLDAELLGYPTFLDMANLGSVLREQLLEPVAALARPQAEAMVALYRHLLTGAPAPDGVTLGLAAQDEADPRLLEQAARGDALQALWSPAHLIVDDENESKATSVEVSAPSPQALEPALATVLLSVVLTERLEGAEAAWDRATLLEASGARGDHLDGFLGDRLQLTDKGDLGDLARVLHTLEVPWEQAEPAVRGSLHRSAGGERRAHGADVRMAARSRRGADEQQTARDLYADRSQIDESQAARGRGISSYLSDLQQALEELE